MKFFKMIALIVLLILIVVLSCIFGDIVSSIATAMAVVVAAWQIWEGHRLSSAEFEDSFDQQYRALSYQIPVNALIGKDLSTEKRDSAREAIYNYLDLCNEQVYQRTKNRISYERWVEWASGMEENLKRPLFKEVWMEIKDSTEGSFSYLERIEAEGFKTDPAKWENA